MTIAYKYQCPHFLDNVFGVDPAEVHIHIRRIPVAEIPSSESEVADWLMDAFVLKDQLLQDFNSRGYFPSQITEKEISTSKSLVNLTVIVALTVVFTYLTLFSSFWFKIYIVLSCVSLASATYFSIRPTPILDYVKAAVFQRKDK